MKTNGKIIVTSLAVIFICSGMVFHAYKSYTPIEKDESLIVPEYRQEDLNRLAKKQYKKKNEIKEKEILKEGVKKTLYFTTDPVNDEARRILCDFLHCDSNAYKEKDYWGIDGIRAEKFDYDDDGVDEVIGYWLAGYGSDGPCLNILKKAKRGYRDVSLTCNINVKFPVVMLNHKTSGCFDYIVHIMPYKGKSKIIEKRNLPIVMD